MTSTLAPPIAAARARRPGWRDPRLWLGVALVALSVLGGSRLLAAADDTVEVWAVAADHAAGDRLDREDLEVRRVRFADAAELDRYLPAAEQLPGERHLRRPVGAGELLPRQALGSAEETGVVTVPLILPAMALEPGLRVGDHVDIWVTARDAQEAERVLGDATVVAAPEPEGGFGATGERQLVLGLTAEQATGLPRALAAIAGGDVTVSGLD